MEPIPFTWELIRQSILFRLELINRFARIIPFLGLALTLASIAFPKLELAEPKQFRQAFIGPILFKLVFIKLVKPIMTMKLDLF